MGRNPRYSMACRGFARSANGGEGWAGLDGRSSPVGLESVSVLHCLCSAWKPSLELELTNPASQFSQPIALLLLTNLFSVIILLPIFLLTIISKPLRKSQYPLMFLPLGLTVATYAIAIAASIAVSRAREKEGRRVLQVLARRHGLRSEEPVAVAKTTTRTSNGVRTTTTTAARTSPVPARSAAQEEHVARVLVGMESRSYLSTLWNWVRALAGFVGGLAGATCLVVSLLLSLTRLELTRSSCYSATSASRHTTMRSPSSARNRNSSRSSPLDTHGALTCICFASIRRSEDHLGKRTQRSGKAMRLAAAISSRRIISGRGRIRRRFRRSCMRRRRAFLDRYR